MLLTRFLFSGMLKGWSADRESAFDQRIVDVSKAFY